MPHNKKRNGSQQSAEAGWRLERQPREVEGAHYRKHIRKVDTAPNPPACSQLNTPAGGNGGRTHATLSLLTQGQKGMGSPQAESNQPITSPTHT